MNQKVEDDNNNNNGKMLKLSLQLPLTHKNNDTWKKYYRCCSAYNKRQQAMTRMIFLKTHCTPLKCFLFFKDHYTIFVCVIWSRSFMECFTHLYIHNSSCFSMSLFSIFMCLSGNVIYWYHCHSMLKATSLLWHMPMKYYCLVKNPQWMNDN